MEWVENEVREVGPGVWIRSAVDNICWYDLGEAAAVIDALEDPAQADVVRGLIRETTGRDLKWVVTTHWDADHIACNPQWRREGALVVAHRSCALSAGDWEGRPDVSYADTATLQGEGERRIDMEWLGGTHTPWDTVLHFPQARVLHIADLFGWGLIPCKPTPEKTARLKQVLNRVLAFDADVLVCGHGPTLTPDHVRRFLSYFDQMLQDVPALVSQGKTLDEIEKLVTPPSDMEEWWRFAAWKHKKNIELLAEYAAR